MAKNALLLAKLMLLEKYFTTNEKYAYDYFPFKNIMVIKNCMTK